MRISVIYALCVFLIIIIILFSMWQSCYKINPYLFDSGLPGKTLVIVAGVHGNERSGSNALMSMIHSGDIHITSGKIIIIPYANWCGWLADKRSVPAKGINEDLIYILIQKM